VSARRWIEEGVKETKEPESGVVEKRLVGCKANMKAGKSLDGTTPQGGTGNRTKKGETARKDHSRRTFEKRPNASRAGVRPAERGCDKNINGLEL
jgi:hypothetical protein